VSPEIYRIPSGSSKFQQSVRIGNVMTTRYAHLGVQNLRINVNTGKGENWPKLIWSSFRKTWYSQGRVVPRRELKVCNSRSCVGENGKNSRNIADTRRKIT